MVIEYNGLQTQISDTLTLQELLDSQQLSDKKGIAVAVNEEVIPRSSWSAMVLQEQDSILVIKATQGG